LGKYENSKYRQIRRRGEEEEEENSIDRLRFGRKMRKGKIKTEDTFGIFH